MTPSSITTEARGDSISATMASNRPAWLGGWALTFALAIVFLWFGGLKFTAYEESGVAGFIMNSPIIGWLHGAFGIAGGAEFLGVFEILTGLLIAGRLVDSRLSLLGGLMGAWTFLVTLTLLLTTPGVIQPGFDNPLALSAVPGQFLLKDLISFAACLWLAGVSWREVQTGRAERSLS